jgi:hypothetical protein
MSQRKDERSFIDRNVLVPANSGLLDCLFGAGTGGRRHLVLCDG